MNWLLVALYLAALVAILLIAAGVLYVICYLTSQTDEDAAVEGAHIKPKQKDAKLAAVGKQTMISSLQKSATDNDVVVATAMSSIPLRELGGKSNDIIVEVSQQMYLDKDLNGHDEHQCVVCDTRKDIAWNQVSCYAQTTIGVLVYKRALKGDQDQPLKSSLVWDCFGSRSQQAQPQDLTTATFRERSRSASATTIAPESDSRLSFKPDLRSRSASKSKISSKPASP